MKIIQRDITTIDDGVVFHQVNCQGVMRSGVAKAIREKWPEVFSEYSKFCQNKTPEELLGTYNAVNLSDEYSNLTVVNCFSQKNYGYDGELYTDYDSIDKIFREVYRVCCHEETKFYAPYLYGCVRGGGDWNKVSEIICRNISDIIFCKYGE